MPYSTGPAGPIHWIDAVLDDAQVDPADVLGFSMGGNVAQAFALAIPSVCAV
jgi:pimeloyl-ACP methyl ester carboxylesterase